MIPRAVGRWIHGMVDLLFGYDFFISYAHSDGMDYPCALADQLETDGFRVFLDSRVYVAGDDLRVATRRRVRMSKKLVVVVGPHALRSYWVLREVQACLAAGRAPIAIDVNAALADAPADDVLKQLLEDKLYLSERDRNDAATVSDSVIQGLNKSFEATRQDTQRLRIVSVAALLFALIAVVALWQSHVAEARRKEAVIQQERAYSRALAANAEAQLPIDPEVSVLLALASLDIAKTAEAEQALRHALPNLYVEATLRGHDHIVQAARYSHDGERIVTASFDGTARIWDVARARATVVLKGHKLALFDAAFSLDDARVVTSSVDGTVRVWNAETGAVVHVFAGFDVLPTWVTFSDDGRLVLASTANRPPRIWNAVSGELVAMDAVTNGIASRDGRWIIAFAKDSAIEILAATDRHRVASFAVDGAYILGGINRQASRLLTGDGHGTVSVWNTRSGNREAILSGHDEAVVGAAFSSLSKIQRVATASGDHTARIWSLTDHNIEFVLRGHTAALTAIVFSPNGRWLATGSEDRTVRLWDSISGRPVAEYRGHDGKIETLMFARNGEHLLSAGGSTARVWRVSAEQTITRYWRVRSAPQKVTSNATGGLIVTTGVGREIGLWGARTGLQLAPIRAVSRAALEADFHPNSHYLATAGFDGVVRVWDAGNQRMLREFKGHTGPVMSVAFAPDGETIVSGSADRSVRLWRGAQMEPIATFAGHTGDVLSVKFAPNASQIASASSDKTVRLWDVARGELVGTPLQHEASVKTVDFGDDGRRLVAATNDHNVHLWDTNKQERIRQLEHPAVVAGALFMPTGKLIVTGAADGYIRAWDSTTGELVVSMKTRAPAVRRIALDAKGDWILTTESDDAVYRYPAEMIAPLDQLRRIAEQRLRRALTAAEHAQFME